MSVPGLAALAHARDHRVSRRLLRDRTGQERDETILDDGQVHHHWVVYVVPVLESLLALAALVLMFSSGRGWWVWFFVAAGLLGHAAWRSLESYMDVFVITDIRVFRVSGLGPTKYATTPLTRIVDITVDQTLLGQSLGYGHFTFESAAQEQGLRDVRFVTRPLERDKMIQQQQLRLLRK